MYKLLLISKYLRKRRIAWVSLLAVCLCTAMVLVVLSVMGGWLRMFRENFRGLSGTVMVQNGNYRGFPHYEEMIAGIEKLPGVTAASPSIQTLGMINLLNVKQQGVQVVGVDVEKIAKINTFPQSLWRQYQEPLELAADPKASPTDREAYLAQAASAATRPSFDLPLTPEVYRAWFPNARQGVDPSRWPGMIAGAGVLNIHRDENGEWQNRGELNYKIWARLTLLSLNATGGIDEGSKTELRVWVVDSSRLKVWQVDDQTVYVPLDLLQRSLAMTATEDEPARVTQIDIATKPGVNLEAIGKAVQGVVDEVMRSHGRIQGLGDWPTARTWEQVQAKYLSAIEQQVVLTTTLFSFISVVAVFLIFCIFYMIVKEKTKDIGIVKSVGATSGGVAVIFLGYGCAIGFLGGALGLGVGFVIVHNINFIHDQIAHVMGVKIWNPETYIFDTIPNTVDPLAAGIIFAVAITSSIIGATIPAYRAARLNPVDALRFE